MIKCSRSVWRKFSPYQKKLFDVLNYKFNLGEYTSGIFKSKVTNEEMAKLAHNLAIVACWYIGDNCMHTNSLQILSKPIKNDSKNKRSK